MSSDLIIRSSINHTKAVVTKQRYCKVCNAPITWRYNHDSITRYDQRKFCSKTCQYDCIPNFKADNKCVYCDKVMNKSLHETIQMYKRRKFCNSKCYKKFRILGQRLYR
jgi:hypothetical protein